MMKNDNEKIDMKTVKKLELYMSSAPKLEVVISKRASGERTRMPSSCTGHVKEGRAKEEK